ncbi:MAG: hypothetical protein U0805_15795 [Pirellulales bacterium]
MTTHSKQELLPPLSQEPVGLNGWLDWLTDPLPKRFMLPATGLLIMGLDWLFFSEEAATLGLAIPFTSVVGFLAGSLGTYHLQRKFGLDTKAAALAKSLLAGFLVGIPFPLAGTLAGAWIMTTSGILGLKDKLWRNRFSRK